MATKAFEAVSLELQDGSQVEIKPLTIKRLRKFMEIIKDFDGEADEIESMNAMVSACAVAIEQSNPELAADRDKLEDALDVPTMWRILEVAGGIKLDDPNLMRAALAGTN